MFACNYYFHYELKTLFLPLSTINYYFTEIWWNSYFLFVISKKKKFIQNNFIIIVLERVFHYFRFYFQVNLCNQLFTYDISESKNWIIPDFPKFSKRNFMTYKVEYKNFNDLLYYLPFSFWFMIVWVWFIYFIFIFIWN